MDASSEGVVKWLSLHLSSAMMSVLEVLLFSPSLLQLSSSSVLHSKNCGGGHTHRALLDCSVVVVCSVACFVFLAIPLHPPSSSSSEKLGNV